MHYEMSNGLGLHSIFKLPRGFKYGDLTVLPVDNSESVTKQCVDLRRTVSPSITLGLPVFTSPMDSVSELDTCRVAAEEGAMGIFHMNLSIDELLSQISKVKRSRMGIVTKPICRLPSHPVSELQNVKDKHGFSTLLVTEDGTPESRLLGMVTRGHAALQENNSVQLGRVMIPVGELMTMPASQITNWSEARDYLRNTPAAHKLPLLNPNGTVAGFVTRKDVEKLVSCPHALIDPDTGQLRVGAAVSTQPEDDKRVPVLIAAGVDMIVIDCAQGSTGHAVKRIEQVKKLSPDLPVVAGNIVTPWQADMLIDAGANALRVGMSSGSVCITQNVLCIGRDPLSAVYHLSQHVRNNCHNVAIIADGGIRTTGDVLMALLCGADFVMLGGMIAGCDETPAEVVVHEGRNFKRHRGMGSKGAIKKAGKLRYGKAVDASSLITQGREDLTDAIGPLKNRLAEIRSALGTGLEYLGCTTFTEAQKKVDDEKIRFEPLSR